MFRHLYFHLQIEMLSPFRMDRNKMLMKISSILFLLLCLSGFWYQVTDMSIKYFGFPVATKTSLELPNRYILHDLDLCFNYRNMIGKIKPTIRNILSITPDSSDLIDSCRVKKPNSYQMAQLERDECYDLFNVSKYVVHSDICYSVKYKNRSHEFYYEAISNSVEDSRAVFRIALPKESPLRLASTVRPVIYGHGYGHPYLSMTLATGFWLYRDSYDNSFWSDYFMYKTFYLPSPYETNCLDYSYNNCIYDCLTNLLLEEFAEIPYSMMTDEPYDYVQVNLSDPVRDRKSREFYVYCKKQMCPANSCVFSYVSTFSFKYHSFNHKSVAFSVSTLSSPDTFIYSIAALNFNEYVIFIMSCAGSWLGVSILALNPVTFYQRQYQRRGSNIKIDQPMKNLDAIRKTIHCIERRQNHFAQKVIDLHRMNRDILEMLGTELV